MPAVIKHNYLDRNPEPSDDMTKYSKILDKHFRGPFDASKEILIRQKKKSVYAIPWHDSLGDTVSALLDLDTESSIYQA